MTNDKAELHVPGKEVISLPILSGTLGPNVMDVTSLNRFGIFTFDPGFQSTAACKSTITFIGFPRNSHPMAIMCGAVGALSAFYHDSLDIKNINHRDLAALR